MSPTMTDDDIEARVRAAFDEMVPKVLAAPSAVHEQASRARPFAAALVVAAASVGTIVLVQRRVFILPTAQGLLFAGVIVLMLVGAVNYDLSLGFILAFLLGATGIQSMLHTFRNLANLRIAPGRVQPVFAGEQAQFRIRIANQARVHRHSIGITRDKRTAVYIDVPPGDEMTAIKRRSVDESTAEGLNS